MSSSEIDRFVVRERNRLAILLAIGERGGAASFMEIFDSTPMKHRARLTAHGRKLADAGLVQIAKSGAGSTQRSTFTLTAAGIAALERLKNELKVATSFHEEMVA